MKRSVARKLTPEIQQHSQDLAIRLFQQDQKRADMAKIVGVHYGVACRWIRAWEQGGELFFRILKSLGHGYIAPQVAHDALNKGRNLFSPSDILIAKTERFIQIDLFVSMKNQKKQF